MMKHSTSWLGKLKKPGNLRTIFQVTVFLAAILLPVGIFHMICPFGGIETLTRFLSQGLYIPKTGITNILLLIVVLISTILAGPVFCGWICPLGSIQDWTRTLAKKLKIKKIRIPEKLDFIFSFARYLVLFLIIRATYLSFNLVFLKADPYYALMHFYTGEVAPVALGVLAVTLVTSLFIERPWCRYLCPLGAILGPLGKISILKVKKPSQKCISCGACSRSCPVGLDPSSKESVTSSRCIRCGLCEPACPPKLKTSKSTFRNFMIIAILLVGMFFISAQFATNHGESSSFGSAVNFEAKPQTTLTELATNTAKEMSEIYSLLGLPEDYDATIELVDIEDDFEEKTWSWIEERLKDTAPSLS
jgi:NapH/MauN family ferredoxin-type protein